MLARLTRGSAVRGGVLGYPCTRPRAEAHERGSAAVEFALVSPLVVVLIAAAIASVGVSAQAVRLADAAGSIARAEGRSDSAAAARLAEALAPGASVSVVGDPATSVIVCVRLDDSATVAGLRGAVRISARGCAPGAGR